MFKQSVGQLIGIAKGLVADRVLNDVEVYFLHNWMTNHNEIAFAWPGDIIFARLKAVLADNVVTEDERTHLIKTLEDLTCEDRELLAGTATVTQLAFDDVTEVVFSGHMFCLTGDFVYAPREVCERHILERGGITKNGVSKKIHYVVVGSLGSQEWKHGSYGTKIDRAMELKRAGATIAVVKEDVWAAAL